VGNRKVQGICGPSKEGSRGGRARPIKAGLLFMHESWGPPSKNILPSKAGRERGSTRTAGSTRNESFGRQTTN